MNKRKLLINLQLFAEGEEGNNEDLFELEDDYDFEEDDIDTSILEGDKQYTKGIDDEVEDDSDNSLGDELDDEDELEGAGEDEEFDEDSEDEEGEFDEDSEDDTDDLDKKTKALIHYKREAKENKSEVEKLRAEIEELKSQNREKQMEAMKETMIDDFIQEGYSEKEAKRRANLEVENQLLKEQLADSKFKRLEVNHPGISKYKDKILEYKRKYPELDFTEGEIYEAKFNKNKYDIKTQAEQEALHRRRKAKSKSGVDAAPSKSGVRGNVKMTSEEKRAYEIAKEYDPSLTPKDFISELYDE